MTHDERKKFSNQLLLKNLMQVKQFPRPNDGMRVRFVNYTQGYHRLCVFAGDWLIPVDNRDGYEFTPTPYGDKLIPWHWEVMTNG